eukprot:TRINITY_DN7838_c0_g1_i1.p1 TRINITY_DN7838_c0_g1~~TRINITY_DN7838_c0_g1_i1.p1  ORF type:complete len:424 (+),score=80.13 TRINITY_DN7838_c0_g1_i1:114-1385(+)
MSEPALRDALLEEALQAAESLLKAAREAADVTSEAEALRRLSEIHLERRSADVALQHAKDALAALEKLPAGGEQRESLSASAQVAVAEAQLGRIALLAEQAKLPCRADTLGALRAAKAAYRAYSAAGDAEGKERAGRAMSAALLASGVPASMSPSPEAACRQADLPGLLADLGAASSPFQAPELTVRGVDKLKKPGASPGASRVFDRSSFGWTDPSADYTYQLIWEKYNRAKNKAKKLDVLAVAHGSRSSALPLYHSLRPHDPAESREAAGKPLCVHINTYNSSTNYGSCLMASMHTISSMVTGNLRKLTFVQLGECAPEGSIPGETYSTAARQVALSPAILAMIRSARIEVPQLAIGFVAGDAASWMTDREQMISAIFEQHENIEEGETELMWRRGEPYMPTLKKAPLPKSIAPKFRAPHDT